MDELRLNLEKAKPVGQLLRDRGFVYPRGGRQAELAPPLRTALGRNGAVGAARLDALGQLEPAASGEGLGWGHDAWSNLDAAPITGDTPGLVLRYFDGAGIEWRWSLCFATGHVRQVPRIFNLRAT